MVKSQQFFKASSCVAEMQNDFLHHLEREVLFRLKLGPCNLSQLHLSIPTPALHELGHVVWSLLTRGAIRSWVCVHSPFDTRGPLAVFSETAQIPETMWDCGDPPRYFRVQESDIEIVFERVP